MTIIIDASFGHAQVTPANLKRIGATGAILYAGCDDSNKNATKAEVQALLDAGFLLGLVIENGTQDMLDGKAKGVAYGQSLLAGAKALGYDTANCVLYTAADWDVSTTQEAQVDAFMQGFGSVVPVPGVYGSSHVLDYAAANGHAKGFWQSDSTSFSDGPSAHAHLLQRWNDPRALGLPFDINDVQHAPIGLMGENTNMPFDAAQTAALEAMKAEIITELTQQINAVPVSYRQHEYNEDTTTNSMVSQILTAVKAQPAGGSINVTELAAQLVAAMGAALSKGSSS